VYQLDFALPRLHPGSLGTTPINITQKTVDMPPETTEIPKPEPEWMPSATLGEALPVRLLRAREAIMQFYRPLFQATGITERQWRVLRNLFDEPFLEPSELAVRAFMQPPNVSRVLNELSALNYVTRVASGKDQRRARITLTETGRAATVRIGRHIEARTSELLKTSEATEFARLGELLEMVIDLPQKYPRLTGATHQPPGP